MAMDKKYKRVQVVLCQYMEPLGWATCQRLSPHPDILFYKISNDVHVHRLFLNLRCDERSTPTHPVSSVWHLSFRHTDINKSSISQVIFLSKSHTNSAICIVPPPRALWSVELHQDNLLCADWSGRRALLHWRSFFFYFLNSLFLKNSFQVPWGVRVESMPIAYSS